MTRIGFVLAISFAASSWAVAQEPAKPTPHPVTRVSAAAVWNPPVDMLAAVRQKCGEADPTHMERCFLNEMKSAGASPEALAFAESLAASLGVVYLRAFRRLEKVDVAYIQYAFRANELEGVLLVNGNPSPIDVDDDSQYPQAELQKYPAYAALANAFPNISIWPADRSNPQLPKLDLGGFGRQTFLV